MYPQNGNVYNPAPAPGAPVGNVPTGNVFPSNTSIPTSNSSSDIILQPEKKSKKKIIVGVIVLVVLAVVAVIAVIMITMENDKPYPDGMTAEEVSANLSDETIDTVGDLENAIQEMAKNSLSAKNTFGYGKNDEQLKELENELAVYKNAYETILKYEAVQFKADTAEYFTTAKQKMSEMIPKYEEIVRRYTVLYNAVYEEADDIEELGVDAATMAKMVAYTKIAEVNEEYQAMECTVEERTTVGTECYSKKAELKELEEAVSGEDVDLRKYLFPDGTAEYVEGDNLVRKDLRAIVYSLEDKTVDMGEGE